MKTRNTVLAVLAATVALGGLTITAAAAREGRGEAITFERLDVNGDGKLSVADAEAMQAEHFAMMDTDGNGSLSAEEFANRHDAGRAAHAAEMVESHDQDGDGMLSADELASAEPRAKGGKHRGHRGMRGNPMERLERLIEQFDTDDDAALSEAEFDTAKAAMLERGGHRRGGKDRRGE